MVCDLDSKKIAHVMISLVRCYSNQFVEWDIITEALTIANIRTVTLENILLTGRLQKDEILFVKVHV